MTQPTTTPSRRAIVIGGSLGGLFTGNLLRLAGWTVDIYERSAHTLDSRGGGIVLQPEVVEAFARSGVDLDGLELGVRSRNRTLFAADGSILGKQLAPQMQTSWSLIYNTLRARFGEAHYHQGRVLAGIEQDEQAKTVTARFAEGGEESADLLIGADGNGSTVRRLLWPDSEPTYAGYLAWRGLLAEDAMPPAAREGLHGDFAFANAPGSHMLGYLVPGEGGATGEGQRLYNFVWYRVADEPTLHEIMTDRDGTPRGFSMPEGKLAERWVRHLRDEARLILPPPFRELVLATAEPFAQAIRDLTVQTMVKGRVVLIGDAAFIPRPHTAASTSKAAANALALSEALIRWPDSVEQALAHWEPEQLGLGQRLYRQGTRAGDHLLFGK
ncbi:FAD binding domain-containing protein [Pseudomonas sp.]|uniref:FAD binding domain-containing protein n=1 Tax=Pseudomonas sp. TaxID=306 RepID=UPI0028ACBAC5|nr:FAD binding domain-containing protein [Pseudomonas sp.]